MERKSSLLDRGAADRGAADRRAAACQASVASEGEFQRAEARAVDVDAMVDGPAVVVVRRAFHRQQRAPRVSFKMRASAAVAARAPIVSLPIRGAAPWLR